MAMKSMNAESVRLDHPCKVHTRPPFSEQREVPMPGRTDQMTPAPDHGEETYVGSGKLRG